MAPKKWMKPPPGHDLFLAPLQLSLSKSDYEKVEFAYQISKYGHSGQVRDDGSRYFDHPKAVAWIYIKELGGRDPRVIIEQGPHAILDKLLDRLHNLRQLGSCTKAKREKQIAETRGFHLPLLIPALKAHGNAKQWAVYAARLEELIHEAIAAYEVSEK